MAQENPFSPAFPISPKYFINRVEILDSFRRALERSIKTDAPMPDNIAIIADWGLGKTSLLRKFESIALEEFKEKKFFSAIVELSPNLSGNSSFISKILDDVSGNFALSYAFSPFTKNEMRNEIRNWRLELSPAANQERGNSGNENVHTPSYALKDVFLRLWKILEKSGVEVAIVMIDDLHYLTENCPESFYGLMETFQKLPSYGCNFILCVTGEEKILFKEKNANKNFLRRFNISHNLKLFSIEETKKVIKGLIRSSNLSLEIDEIAIQKVHEVTSGHPFFIHFMMRELLSLQNSGKISLDYFEENYPAFKEIIEREKFSSDFSLASPKEKKILLNAAQLQQMFSPSEIENVKNARSHLRFLLKKNLIKKHDRGKYSLYHPLFKEYLGGLMHGGRTA